MNQRISILAGLLVVQLLLAGTLILRSGEDQRISRLLDFTESAVTGLSIADPEGQAVDLTRGQDGWRLDGMPADSDKVTGVIEALTTEASGWPVATSEGSQERFEVTDGAFQRRVRFDGEAGALAEVYIGTSPGFRRVHARREGDDAVYAIDFGVHELPVRAGDWLDKSLFQTGEVSVVALPDGQRLTRDEAGHWSVDGAPADPDAVQRFVDRIERLTVLGFYEPAEGETLGDPATLVVLDAAGRHTLKFRFDEQNDEYVLTSDRIAGEFTVASYIVEQILIDAADLVQPEAERAEAAAGPAEEDQVLTAQPAAES